MHQHHKSLAYALVKYTRLGCPKLGCIEVRLYWVRLYWDRLSQVRGVFHTSLGYIGLGSV